jgi:hypothetical protein
VSPRRLGLGAGDAIALALLAILSWPSTAFS